MSNYFVNKKIKNNNNFTSFNIHVLKNNTY